MQANRKTARAVTENLQRFYDDVETADDADDLIRKHVDQIMGIVAGALIDTEQVDDETVAWAGFISRCYETCGWNNGPLDTTCDQCGSEIK